MKRLMSFVLMILLVIGLCACGGGAEEDAETDTAEAEDGVILSDDSSDFVLLSEAVPDAILEIRYYSTYNFVGDRIDGYEEPLAFLTTEAAAALKEASDELVKELQTWVKKETAPYKYPRIVEYTDEMPKTIGGKIKRKLIRHLDGVTD